MPDDLKTYLLERGFLTEPQLALLASEAAGKDPLAAAVERQWLTPAVAQDIRDLLNDDKPLGLEPELPGLILLKEVGRGARGRVYRAWQTGLRRVVAVKLMSRDSLQRPEDRTRFVREARIAARLSHPAIMRAYDIGSSGNHVYIVLEYVDGQTLRDRLAENGPMPMAEALAMAADVADGLAFAAGHGITHRDIKPANIQVLPGGAGKILDLGLARPEGDTTVTSPLSAPGTPSCISPEQADGGLPVTPKADVYSLGVVLYRCLSGEYPFRAQSATEMLRMHRSAQPESLIGKVAHLPPGLAGLVAAMLAKEPDARPDAATVATQLRGMLSALTPPRSGARASVSSQFAAKIEQKGGRPASGPQPRVGAVPSPVSSAMVERGEQVRAGGGGKWAWIGSGIAIAGIAVAAGLMVGNKASESDAALKEREQQAARQLEDAEKLATLAREFARATRDLAQAAAAEQAAGPSLGSYDERLRKAIDQHDDLFTPGANQPSASGGSSPTNQPPAPPNK